LTDDPDTPPLDELYAASAALHGHVCPGVILGTRMAVLGMSLLGLPPGVPDEDLTVYVETARCATDAVQATTHATVGRHTLRVLDFGKMAATFALDGEAVRVVALESSRAAADRLHPELHAGKERQTAAYREMHDGELFEVSRVRLLEAPRDPHKAPRPKGACPHCAETFEVSKGVRTAEGLLCAACAGEGYYLPALPHGAEPSAAAPPASPV
jgi:formylmethanofuran dehydrogenase subunit E